MNRLLRSGTRVLCLAAAAIAVSACLASEASATSCPNGTSTWCPTYVQNATFNPGGIGLSDFNYEVDYNVTNWTKQNGDNFPEEMGLTLCDASYNCYSYDYSSYGHIQDPRSISYGRAKCHAYDNNMYPINVQSCWTENY